MRTNFKIELDAFQGRCASLQSITASATPALMAGPAGAARGRTTVTARLVSAARTCV